MSQKVKTMPKLTEKFFEKEYHDNNKSFSQLAEEYGTYPNKFLRAAKKLGIKIKDKSESQLAALNSGRATHPTEGTIRSSETKEKISDKVSDSWSKITTKERKRRARVSKDQWENMSEADKQNLLTKAHKAIRETSTGGSKLEKAMLEYLLGLGYDVQFHKEQFLVNDKLQLDLFLPSNNIAIEIDGPSHHSAVWGDKAYRQVQNADAKKDGLIIGRGLTLIRVKQVKPYSQKNERELLKVTAKMIKKVIDKKVKPNKIYRVGE